MISWAFFPVSVLLYGASAWCRSVLLFGAALAVMVAGLVVNIGYPAPSVLTPAIVRDGADVISWTTDGERWIWVWIRDDELPRVITIPYSDRARRQYEQAEATAEAHGKKLKLRRPPGWAPEEEDLTMYPAPWPPLPPKQGG